MRQALALSVRRVGITPQARKIHSQRMQAAAQLFIDCHTIFLTLLLVLLLRFLKSAQLPVSNRLPGYRPPAGYPGLHACIDAEPVPPHSERVPPVLCAIAPLRPIGLAILAARRESLRWLPASRFPVAVRPQLRPHPCPKSIDRWVADHPPVRPSQI